MRRWMHVAPAAYAHADAAATEHIEQRSRRITTKNAERCIAVSGYTRAADDGELAIFL